jgi:hypothetical protein
VRESSLAAREDVEGSCLASYKSIQRRMFLIHVCISSEKCHRHPTTNF